MVVLHFRGYHIMRKAYPNRITCGFSRNWGFSVLVRFPTFNARSLGRIEIQVRLNLDRGRFLALYLVRRTNFEVSMIEKILFDYTTETFCGSLDTEPVSWVWFADPHFVVLS